MYNNGIITGLPVRQEASLARTYDKRQNKLNSVNIDFDVNLYIVLQSPIGLKFLRSVAFAYLGIWHKYVVFTEGFISRV